MPNGGGDLHDLWDRLHDVETICIRCQGADWQKRVESLEKQVTDVKSDLRVLVLKVGLIVGLLGVAAQIGIALVQAEALRKLIVP